MDIDKKYEIIGYSPDLKFEKNTYSKYVEEIEKEEEYIDNEYIDDTTENLSNTLNSFIANKPSNTLNTIKEAKNLYDSIIDKFLETVEHENFKSYVSTDKEEELKEIEDKNFKDVFGSTALESFIEIVEIKDMLDSLETMYSFLVYGKDVDYKSSSEIDEAYINKMILHEEKFEYKYINYSMLYYDTQVSYIIRSFCEKLSSILVDLSSIDDSEKSKNTSTDDLKTIQKGFEITNSFLEKTKYSKKDYFKNLINHIKRIFNIKDCLDVYNNTFNNLFSFSEEADLIYEIKIDSENEIATKVTEMLKLTLYLDMVKTDITKNLLKKKKLRNFF